MVPETTNQQRRLTMSKKPTAKSQIESKSSRVLSDSEMDAVSGGFPSSFSDAIKSLGDGLSTMARKG